MLLSLLLFATTALGFGCTTYHRVADGACVQACLRGLVGKCRVSRVVEFGGLSKGGCVNLGFTIPAGKITQVLQISKRTGKRKRRPRVCGKVTVNMFMKRPGGGVPEKVTECKKVTTQADFNLNEYVTGGRWYTHQQMAIEYMPVYTNYCGYTDYKTLTHDKFKVNNYANAMMVNGPVFESDDTTQFLGGICGVREKDDASKLRVGPCRLPKSTYSPIWIIAAGPSPDNYEWALVSGGQPKNKGVNGCSTGTGVNGSGLWIFTRSQERDQDTIDMVRAIAKAQGFDLSVLKDVEQEGCTYELKAPADEKSN